ncbi:hypothetical protein ACJJTC_014978 [Scirpophaga incertulas]
MPGLSLTYTRIADVKPTDDIVHLVFMVVKLKHRYVKRSPPFEAFQLIIADASGSLILHVMDVRGTWIRPGDVVGEFTGNPMAADPGPDAIFNFFEYEYEANGSGEADGDNEADETGEADVDNEADGTGEADEDYEEDEYYEEDEEYDPNGDYKLFEDYEEDEYYEDDDDYEVYEDYEADGAGEADEAYKADRADGG